MVIVKTSSSTASASTTCCRSSGAATSRYVPPAACSACSKLARLVDMFARRLQVQERLTEQVSQAVMDAIDAKGVRVMIEARSPLHDDARRREAELGDGDVVGAGHFPRIGRDARGIPRPYRQPRDVKPGPRRLTPPSGAHSLSHRPLAGATTRIAADMTGPFRALPILQNLCAAIDALFIEEVGPFGQMVTEEARASWLASGNKVQTSDVDEYMALLAGDRGPRAARRIRGGGVVGVR